jgi:hypothetical protein
MTRLERVGLVVCLLVAVVLMWPLRGQVTDGTYIWLRYADHLAHGHGLVFNPNERIYSCTAPLSVGLVADGIALGLDGLAVAHALGILAGLASIVLFMQLMRRTVDSPLARVLATLTWSVQPWMLQWSCSGLGTSLAMTLVLGGFVALTEGKRWGERPVRTGALWALAALARSGAVLLMALWAIALLVDANNRQAIRRLVFGLAPVVLIYGAWLAFARLYYGSTWPLVLSQAPQQDMGWVAVIANVGAQLRMAWGGGGLLIVGAIAAAILGGRGVWSLSRSALHYLPWAWVLALPALYASRGVLVETRHLVFVAPIAYWLAWRLLAAWWACRPPALRGQLSAALMAGLVTVLVVAQNVVEYRGEIVPAVRESTHVLRHTFVAWGERLRREAPAGASIASPVVGAIGYNSGLRVIDLTGLMSPSIAPLLQLHPRRDLVPELTFADVAHPLYVVDASAPVEMLARSRYREAFTLLDYAEGFALYRVDWAIADSLRGRPRS